MPLFLFLLLLFLAPFSLRADDKSGSSSTPTMEAKSGTELIWLKSEAPDLLKTLAPPPASGSPEDKADLTAVITAQKTNTPETVADAKKFAKLMPMHLAEVVTPDFATKYPATLALLDQIAEEVKYFSTHLKKHYMRPRPFIAHPDLIKPVIEANGYSYPSGHATFSFTMVGVLSDLFPAKAQALNDRADLIAQGRVSAGVHYPTDVAAGKKLGTALVRALLANPAIQKAETSAKAEISGKK